jgi:glucosylglycerate synthase
VLVSSYRGGGVTLLPLEPVAPTAPTGDSPGVSPAASQGAIPGYASPLGPLLREGVERGAAVAIVAAEAHDQSIDWLDRLLAPVLDGGFDFVCPAYRRHRTDGAVNTGIVAPLIRTLYGQALRQPLGTETALSAAFARRLLADQDWRRRPEEAGSDAWLIAKALASDARVAQAWLGAGPRPAAGPEDLGETLVRALGLVFGEMERSAAQWQRARPSRPVPTFGAGGFEAGGERPDPARLFEVFTRGLRDLRPVWSLVLPPATLLELQRCAGRPVEAGGLPDEIWARAIFDFSVAHLTRRVERRQLLRSLAPLYLGWLAGLAHAAATLDEDGFEARVEAMATAFEREKRYLIARWRWPDEFNP